MIHIGDPEITRPSLRLAVRVAILGTLAVVAWAGAGAAIAWRYAGSIDSFAPALAALGATALTLIAVQHGLEAGRRRRADRMGGEVVAALGGLAAEVEQIGAKINAEMWRAYAAGLEDGHAVRGALRSVGPGSGR